MEHAELRQRGLVVDDAGSVRGPARDRLACLTSSPGQAAQPQATHEDCRGRAADGLQDPQGAAPGAERHDAGVALTDVQPARQLFNAEVCEVSESKKLAVPRRELLHDLVDKQSFGDEALRINRLVAIRGAASLTCRLLAPTTAKVIPTFERGCPDEPGLRIDHILPAPLQEPEKSLLRRILGIDVGSELRPAVALNRLEPRHLAVGWDAGARLLGARSPFPLRVGSAGVFRAGWLRAREGSVGIASLGPDHVMKRRRMSGLSCAARTSVPVTGGHALATTLPGVRAVRRLPQAWRGSARCT